MLTLRDTLDRPTVTGRPAPTTTDAEIGTAHDGSLREFAPDRGTALRSIAADSTVSRG